MVPRVNRSTDRVEPPYAVRAERKRPHTSPLPQGSHESIVNGSGGAPFRGARRQSAVVSCAQAVWRSAAIPRRTSAEPIVMPRFFLTQGETCQLRTLSDIPLNR